MHGAWQECEMREWVAEFNTWNTLNKLRIRFACTSVANGIKNDSVFWFKSEHDCDIRVTRFSQRVFIHVDEQHYPFNNFELIAALSFQW